jgi:hypothetical protein
MNLFMSGVTAAGGGLVCYGTAGAGCALAVGAGVIGQGDELVDGAVTLVNGVPTQNPTEAALIAAGATPEQARQIESWIDIGATVVDLGGGVVIGVKGGQLVDDLVRLTGPRATATNRTATQADVARQFQQNRQFWTQDPIQFSGNKVFQRNDLIDPNHVSEWIVRGQTVRGTNIERMAAGRAPIGPDGNSVNLHHLTQQQNGAIAEVTQTLHSTNHGVLHMPNTVPSGINRAQFQTWSRNYWKQRAANWGE